MEYTIENIRKLILSKQEKPSSIIAKIYKELETFSKLNAFVTITKESAIAAAKKLDDISVPENNFLFAMPYAAKDNISTKDILTTASSKILSNYIPPFDANVIELLKSSNSIMIGKSTLDELGMGGSGLTAANGKVLNPWNNKFETGGSSSGSAALVATGIVPFALATDTGDSIRRPASFCGIVGLKPTYGSISRQGIIPYAPSFDTVGFFTRNVKDSAIVFDALAKYDSKDSTTYDNKNDCYKNLNSDIKGIKIAYIDEIHQKIIPSLKKRTEELYEQLRSKGAIVEKVNFPENLLKVFSPIYYILTCSEAISSQSNLTGIPFGSRSKANTWDDSVIKSRSAGLGKIIKGRYLIGAYCTSHENQEESFLQSKKIRRLIINEVDKIFNKYDAIIVPSSNGIAPKINVKDSTKMIIGYDNFADNALLLANFNGMPSLTLPLLFEDNMPIGININTKPFSEQKLFNISLAIENTTNLKNLKPGDQK